jgi:hypothetical protein
MDYQGLGFGNFLNNQRTVNFRNAPNVFKGGAFQSLLQPVVAAEDWRSSPAGYLKQMNDLKKQYPNATQEQLDKALSINPPNNRLDDSLARAVENQLTTRVPKEWRHN